MPEACADCRHELDGAGDIALAADGALAHLRETIDLAVVETSGADRLRAHHELELALISRRAAPPPPNVTARWQRVDLDTADETARESLLRQIAGDLTGDDLSALVTRYAATGAPPRDDPAWLARVAAYLTLHPEACDRLQALATDPNVDARGQLVILDMLVAAGTPRAQAALRTVISSAVADHGAGDARHDAEIVSRLALLESPAPETVELADELHRTSTGVVGTSATYAYGSVLGHLASADAQTAMARATALAGELTAAAPAAQARILVALGNSNLDLVVDTAARHAASADASVREAAAMALHRRRGGTAAQILVDLADDPESRVSGMALHLLASGPLPREELALLGTRVAGATWSGGSDRPLVDALARGLADVPEVRPALEAVLDRTTDRQLAAHVRALLSDT